MVLAVAVGLLWLSLPPALAIVDSEVIELHEGESIEHNVVVRNRSRHELLLLGARTSCSCVDIPDFPLTVKPHSDESLPFTVSSEGRKVGQLFSIKVRVMGRTNGEQVALDTSIESVVVD